MPSAKRTRLAATRAPHEPDNLGYGWRIGGLSAIQRCSKGKEASGRLPPPVQYDDDDNLCLDSELLVLTSGTKWAAAGGGWTRCSCAASTRTAAATA